MAHLRASRRVGANERLGPSLTRIRPPRTCQHQVRRRRAKPGANSTDACQRGLPRQSKPARPYATNQQHTEDTGPCALLEDPVSAARADFPAARVGRGAQGALASAPRPPLGALLSGAPRPAPRARGARFWHPAPRALPTGRSFLVPRAPGAPAPLPTLPAASPPGPLTGHGSNHGSRPMV
jgi:hypothetical protein